MENDTAKKWLKRAKSNLHQKVYDWAESQIQ